MTNKTEIQNYLLLEIDTSFDAQIESWITQVTEYIEKMTNRSWGQDDETSIKLYDGNGRTTLLVDDFQSFDELKIDGGVIDEENVKLYPVNEDTKYKLYYSGGFPIGQQNISLEAIYGGVVPSDLKWAATVLVAGIIQKAVPPKGSVSSERIGDYSVSYKSDQLDDFQRANEIIMLNRKYII